MKANRLLHHHYPEASFGGFSDIDGTVAFYTRVQSLIKPDCIVLDVGCGRGSGLQDDPVPWRRQLRHLCGQDRYVIGLDVDSAAAFNPSLNEFHLLDSENWPLTDTSVDIVVSDYVLEHIDKPAEFFAEVFRVLKPGGGLLRADQQSDRLCGPACEPDPEPAAC